MRQATSIALLAWIAGVLAVGVGARVEGADGGPDRVEGTPDMLQSDVRLPEAGVYYCGPVALSNGLMWLAGNGFGKLKPGREGQVGMVVELAGSGYLKTHQNKGTSSPRMMLGALKYVRRQGYEGEVTFEGWRTVDRGFRRQLGLVGETQSLPAGVPDLKRMKEAVAGKDTVIVLDIGWYRREEGSGKYTRAGGHWVTLVGFEAAAKEGEGATLVVHNPDPAAGREASHDRLKWTELTAGVLAGDFQGLPVEAKGFGKVEGIAMPKGADVAILDGVVVLRVKERVR